MYTRVDLWVYDKSRMRIHCFRAYGYKDQETLEKGIIGCKDHWIRRSVDKTINGYNAKITGTKNLWGKCQWAKGTTDIWIKRCKGHFLEANYTGLLRKKPVSIKKKHDACRDEKMTKIWGKVETGVNVATL